MPPSRSHPGNIQCHPQRRLLLAEGLRAVPASLDHFRQTHDYKGHVGFIHTLSCDTRAVLNNMASLVDRERATLMRRVVPAQFLPLVAALALLVLVLSAPSLSEALRALFSLETTSGLP